MQTPNASPLASRIDPSRNADSYFTPQKPSPGDEPFGDVMNRALTEADENRRETERDNANPDQSLQPTFIARADSGNDNGSDDVSAIHTRRSKRANEKPDEAKAASSPFLPITIQPPTTPAPIPDPSAKGSSDSSSSASNPVLDAQAAKAPSPGAGQTKVETSPPANAVPADSDGHGIKAKAGDSSNAPADGTKSKDDPELPSAETLLNTPNSDPASAGANPDTRHAQTAQGKGSVPIATSPPSPDGISAAKQDMTMQKTEKTLKVAGVPEQDLPGNPASGSEELPTGQKLSAKAPYHAHTTSESTSSMDSPTDNRMSAAQSPAPAASPSSAAPAMPIDSRVLERTHDIVALHAMRLGQTSAQSLHVVVKPGAGVQLSLELRQGQNGIEVHAALHKGDFEQMSRHWPELQQRLEARGVRVGTLTTAENFSSTSQQQFQQSKQQTTQDEPLLAGAFAEFALAGSMTEASAARAARASAYRGWETWA